MAVLALAMGLSACGGDNDVPQGAVASVSGKPLSQAEFDHWLGVIAASQQQAQPGKKRKKVTLPKPGTPQYNQLRDQTMTFLVTAGWITGEAADRGVTATDAEVNRSFEQTRDQSFPSKKAYEKFLRSTGQKQQDIDFRVHADVLANKVRQDVTKESSNVSDDDVQNYYKQNEQQFSQPERRDIQLVLTKDEAKAKEALNRLSGGESFKSVVKDFSTDAATKQQQGRLLGVAKGQQDPTLDNAIFSAQQNQIVGPVKTARGYYVFKVSKVTKAVKQGLDQSKEGIRQLLLAQKQQQTLDAWTQDFRKKWRGRTNCSKGFVVAECSNGEEPVLPGAAGGGPPAKSGTGSPPALTAQTATPALGVPGATILPPGATGLPGAPAGPPATTGTGSPPALTAAPIAPTQPGAPQQQVPQQAPPQQAPPQQQGGAPGG